MDVANCITTYHEAVEAFDALSVIVDDEEEPYVSKYKARAILVSLTLIN
jgi:hypothetical protein